MSASDSRVIAHWTSDFMKHFFKVIFGSVKQTLSSLIEICRDRKFDISFQKK